MKGYPAMKLRQLGAAIINADRLLCAQVDDEDHIAVTYDTGQVVRIKDDAPANTLQRYLPLLGSELLPGDGMI
jgi:hypothetical protein